jgi:DNA-directed RNA polymerase specialized sigma24 family protein
VPAPDVHDGGDATRLTLVALAGNGDRDALEQFAARYRPFLLAYLYRDRRLHLHTAEDRVQGFFEEKVLTSGRPVLRDYRPEAGRFRGYLRRSLWNYHLDLLRRETADKRAPDRARSLPGEGQVPTEDESVGLISDAAWALGVLAVALRSLGQGGRGYDLAEIVLARYFDGLTYDQLVSRLGLASAGAAAHAVRVARERFADRLSAVLTGEREGSPADELLPILLELMRNGHDLADGLRAALCGENTFRHHLLTPQPAPGGASTLTTLATSPLRLHQLLSSEGEHGRSSAAEAGPTLGRWLQSSLDADETEIATGTVPPTYEEVLRQGVPSRSPRSDRGGDGALLRRHRRGPVAAWGAHHARR